MPTGRKPYFSYRRRAPTFDSRTSRVASRAPRSTDRSSSARSSRSPIRRRRYARMHGEGRDVRLVDHDPDAAVADDLAAQLRHQVVGEPVGLELLPVRLRRPRGRERRALDVLDRGQVVDRHRPDQQHGVAHRGASSPVSATPPSSGGAASTPRGSVTYSGTRRARSSGIARGQPRGAGPEQRLREAVARGRAERGGVLCLAAVEVHRDQALAGSQPGIRAAREDPRRLAGPGQDAIGRPRGLDEDERRLAGARGGRPEQRRARGHADDRQVQGVREALDGGDPDAQAGEGAGARPDHEAADGIARDALLARAAPRSAPGAPRRAGSRRSTIGSRAGRRRGCRGR